MHLLAEAESLVVPGLLLVLLMGAVVSSLRAFCVLARAPWVGLSGLGVTAVAAVMVLASFVRCIGNPDTVAAAVVGGLVAAWSGSWVGLRLRGRHSTGDHQRDAMLVAAGLPTGGAALGVVALLAATWMEAQPPSALSTILAVDVAPAGPWVLVTGLLPLTGRRMHYVVNLETSGWQRIAGPVQGFDFTADGRAARWTEGGRLGGTLWSIDLESGRRTRCRGLPPVARLLMAETDRVAVVARERVQVIDPATCATLAEAPVPEGAHPLEARFIGSTLRVWSMAAIRPGPTHGPSGGLVISELDLRSGRSGITGRTTDPRGWPLRGVRPDGAQILTPAAEHLELRDGRTGALLAPVPRSPDRGQLVEADRWILAVPDTGTCLGPGFALTADALPSGSATLLDCSCLPCRLLDLNTGRSRVVGGVASEARGWYHQWKGHRAVVPGTPGAVLGLTDARALVRVDDRGRVSPVALP